MSAAGDTSVPVVTSVAEYDVTGGIQCKLQSAVNMVQKRQTNFQVILCSFDSGALNHVCENGCLGDCAGTVVCGAANNKH